MNPIRSDFPDLEIDPRWGCPLWRSGGSIQWWTTSSWRNSTVIQLLLLRNLAVVTKFFGNSVFFRQYSWSINSMIGSRYRPISLTSANNDANSKSRSGLGYLDTRSLLFFSVCSDQLHSFSLEPDGISSTVLHPH